MFTEMFQSLHAQGVDGAAARWVSASDANVREASVEEVLRAEATFLLYCRSKQVFRSAG